MTTPKNVLVTGANGFVGRAVVTRLMQQGFAVTAATRRAHDDMPSDIRSVTVGDIGTKTDWLTALQGCDAVVHLAARVHVMNEQAEDPMAAFRAVNVDGTLNLARHAVAAGVRRFVFMSTIKVNGEGRPAPYVETDFPAPEDPYGLSKLQAEEGLRTLARSSGMEVVVLRPPLVYGPGVRANFLSLLRLADKGWPLPLGLVRNRRSLVYVGNLADAVAVSLTHPNAANRTFFVTDDDDVSTPELIRRMATALERRDALIGVPPALSRILFAMLGRGKAADRLMGSLAADSSAIRLALNWKPPFTMTEGLAETAAWFRRDEAARKALTRGASRVTNGMP